MKRLLLFLILSFSLASSGWAAWTQTNKQKVISGSNPVSIPAFTNPLTSGSLVAVGVFKIYTTINTPTDTAGNTYADCGTGVVLWHGSSRLVQCFYTINTHTTASNVISIANSGGQDIGISASEWTGGAASSIIDVYSSTANGTTTAGSDNLTSGAAVTTVNGDLIFAFAATNNSGTVSAGTGYTLINKPDYYALGEYQIQSSSGSIAATATDDYGAGADYGALLVAFKAAALACPETTTGCQFWVKADAIVGLSDGYPVAIWSDQSGNGHNATGTGASRPTYKTNILNFLPIVRFTTAGNSQLQTAAFTLNQPSTVLMVVNQSGATAYEYIDGLSCNTRRIYSNSPSVSLYAGASLGITGDPTSFSIVGGVYSGGSSLITFNGSTATGNAGSATASGVTLGILCGANLNGDIAEAVVYNTALSTSDRQLVEGYLACKYGLQASLPVGHPYKTACPGAPGYAPRHRSNLDAALEPFDLNGLSPWSPNWVVGKLKGIWWEVSTPFLR